MIKESTGNDRSLVYLFINANLNSIVFFYKIIENPCRAPNVIILTSGAAGGR